MGLKKILEDYKAKLVKEDQFKAKYGTWLCWTGARYNAIDNPNPTKDTDVSRTCYSDAATGEWKPLQADMNLL